MVAPLEVFGLIWLVSFSCLHVNAIFSFYHVCILIVSLCILVVVDVLSMYS